DGRQTDDRESGPLLLSSAARHPTLRGPAGETVRDRGGSFKSGARTESSDRSATSRQCGAGGRAGAPSRDATHLLHTQVIPHGVNFLKQLVERNWATPIEQLTRELLGARG